MKEYKDNSKLVICSTLIALWTLIDTQFFRPLLNDGSSGGGRFSSEEQGGRTIIPSLGDSSLCYEADRRDVAVWQNPRSDSVRYNPLRAMIFLPRILCGLLSCRIGLYAMDLYKEKGEIRKAVGILRGAQTELTFLTDGREIMLNNDFCVRNVLGNLSISSVRNFSDYLLLGQKLKIGIDLENEAIILSPTCTKNQPIFVFKAGAWSYNHIFLRCGSEKIVSRLAIDGKKILIYGDKSAAFLDAQGRVLSRFSPQLSYNTYLSIGEDGAIRTSDDASYLMRLWLDELAPPLPDAVQVASAEATQETQPGQLSQI